MKRRSHIAKYKRTDEELLAWDFLKLKGLELEFTKWKDEYIKDDGEQ